MLHRKKEAESLLFFQVGNEEFLMDVTQAHGAEGPECCVTVLQQLCTAYTVNHSGEINYSHPLGTESQVEEED